MSPAFDPSSPPPPAPAAAADDETVASPSAAASRPSPLEVAERGSGANVAGKKPAWNVPTTNGANEGGAVMGADSWPALSESSKGFTKSSPLETAKALADRSNAAPAGSAIVPPTPKSNSSNHVPSSSPNLAGLASHKLNIKPNSVKRGNGSSSNGSSANAAPVPAQPSISEHTIPVGLELGSESSPKDPPQDKNNWERNQGGSFGPQHHGRGDHRAGYNGNRRGRGGGGSPQGGFGRQQDREWGGYGWNTPQGFSRDPHAPMPLPHQQGYSKPFIRPPPPAPAPFINMPLQVRPFIGPIGFPEVPSVYYAPPPLPVEQLRNAPFIVHQASPAIVSAVDNQRVMLVKQIEYYFSNENLCKDIFLKQKMDDHGWVPISLIAGFNRVKKLTNDIQCILDAVQDSKVVEVQGDKMRRRGDWMNWILPRTPKQYGIGTFPQSLGTSATDTDSDSLAARVQNLGLDEVVSCHKSSGDRANDEAVLRAFGDLNDHMQNGGQLVWGMGKP